MKQVALGANAITVYSIGWLATLAGVSNQNIRLWERTGVLPAPILRGADRSFRFYTAQEIEQYAVAIRNRHSVPKSQMLGHLKQVLAAKRRSLIQEYKTLKEKITPLEYGRRWEHFLVHPHIAAIQNGRRHESTKETTVTA